MFAAWVGLAVFWVGCSAESTDEGDTPEPGDSSSAQVAMKDAIVYGQQGGDALVFFHGLGGAGGTEAVSAAKATLGSSGSYFIPGITDWETPARTDGRVDAFLERASPGRATLSGYSAGRKPVYRWLAAHLDDGSVDRVVLFDPSWENWTEAGGKGGGEVVAQWLERRPSRTALLLYTNAAYVPATKNRVSRTPMETFTMARQAHPELFAEGEERLSLCYVPVGHGDVPRYFARTLQGDLSFCRPDPRLPR